METVIWIVQGLLAWVFVAAGAMKLVRSREDVKEQMGWVEDASDQQFRAVGALELLGAIGVVAPAALGVLEILTPIAAVGLAVTMVAASAVHIRRGEQKELAVPVVLFALAVFVAIERFGAHSL